MINVYASEREIFNSYYLVSRVKPNRLLDFFDGQNYTDGRPGCHKGITKLQDGKYVIIETSQWPGAKDYAYVVSDKEALREILKSGNEELLELKRFRKLKELSENLLKEENE